MTRWLIFPGGTIILDSVPGVDSVIISGVYHRVVHMQNMHGYGTAYLTFAEGVGCTTGPLLPTYFESFFEYEERLVCFSQNSFYPTYLIPFGDLGTNSTDTINNTRGCSTLLTEQTACVLSFKLSPNPASAQIEVASSEKFSNNTFISVYDPTGRRIYNAKADNQKNTQTINTSTRNEGLYMLIIQNNNGIIKREKAVVLK